MKDYKKILEGVVNIINTTEKSDIGFVNICSYIGENCPELKESEDDRIRKALIRYHQSTLNIDGVKGEEILAWLEKQGEKNTAKPKFHEGDWIVHNVANFVFQIVGVDTYGYNVVNREGYAKTISLSNEENYHLWTIQDAKDGDVLVCNINKAEIGGDIEKLPNITPTICIYQNVVKDKDYIHTYCSLYNGSSLILSNSMYYNTFVYNIQPATKEQRDLLFKKMHEAGYMWDGEKKELKEIKNDYEPDTLIEESYQQQADDLIDMVTEKPVWSEEDVNRFRNLIYLVEHSNENKATKEGFIKFINKLKSLRPQNTWMPSDEQIVALEHFVRSIGESGYASPYNNNTKLLYSLLNNLKKLRKK